MMRKFIDKKYGTVNKRNKGGNIKFSPALTFSEVIVSVAILGFLSIAVVSVLNMGDITWRSETTLVQLQQHVRLAIDGMSRELRQSNSSDITITGGSQIDFYIPDVSNVITYSLSGNQIIREHPSGTSKILARNIDSLSFSLSGDTVTIDVSATGSTRGRDLNFSLREKVRLRND